MSSFNIRECAAAAGAAERRADLAKPEDASTAALDAFSTKFGIDVCWTIDRWGTPWTVCWSAADAQVSGESLVSQRDAANYFDLRTFAGSGPCQTQTNFFTRTLAVSFADPPSEPDDPWGGRRR